MSVVADAARTTVSGMMTTRSQKSPLLVVGLDVVDIVVVDVVIVVGEVVVVGDVGDAVAVVVCGRMTRLTHAVIVPWLLLAAQTYWPALLGCAEAIVCTLIWFTSDSRSGVVL